MVWKFRWLAVVIMAVSAASLLAAQSMPAESTKARRKKIALPEVPAVTSADVQSLRDALAAQQQQIQQLAQQLQQNTQALQQSQQQMQQAQAAAAEAQQKLSVVDAQTAQDKDSVSHLNSQLADVQTTLTSNALSSQEEQKRVSALEYLTGRFRLQGDIRVRGESFFQQGAVDRNRARIRIRFGFDGKLNEDFYGGLALATGSLGDPTTTNETFTNFFDRKTIGLDRGYITYNPVAHKWLSLTGGKFAYSWQRTQITGDPDINPEGFTEKLSFDVHRVPGVKNVYVQGMQLLFNEAPKAADSYAVGGQIGATLKPLPFWTATPSFTVLNWRNVDAILNASAFAVQATTTGSSSLTTPVPPIPVPGEGPGCAKGSGLPTVPPCAFSPNGLTNSTFLDASGKPHYLSGFLYADFILNNKFETKSERLPVNLLLEYEDNLNAANHPNDSTGAINPLFGKQSKAYQADISLGQSRNQGDIQFGYAFLKQEQDAVLSSFAESDQRAPTNILQHRLYVNWRVKQNTVAGFTWWHGRTLNSGLQNSILAPGVVAGATDKYLNRFQFDLIYTF